MDKVVMAGELIYMREDLERQLIHRFPWLEHRDLEDEGDTKSMVSCFVGVGWFTLLSNMFQEIQNLYSSLNEPLNKIDFYEIKEKYGLLRITMNHKLPGLQEILNKYETRSSEVCEICGEIGVLRDRAWIVVVCDKCLCQPIR